MKYIHSNLNEFLREFSNIGKTPEGGVTRLPFTSEMKEAQENLLGRMSNMGLEAYIDASGAVIGRLKGRSEKTIIIASHVDSVENGGNFDGIAGVACGMEIIRLIKEKYGNEYPYSIEVIGTNDEEGARFSGGFFSSKAMFESWTDDELKNNKDKNGISIYDAMKDYNLDPSKLASAKRDISDIRAFLEIHIEQGPVLDSSNMEIGIVDTIVGMKRMLITINGRADHAGTTPMNMRNDSIETAACIISRVGDIVRQYKDSVATVGYIKPTPNAINTIAEKTEFSLDIRSTDNIIINSVENEIMELIQKYTNDYDVKRTVQIEPVKMNEEIISGLTAIANKKSLKWMKINSGAGHDSLIAGKWVPTSMIFVPSKSGRSHCPEEYSSIENLEHAVILVYEALISEIK